jgi:hypothetical protein
MSKSKDEDYKKVKDDEVEEGKDEVFTFEKGISPAYK